MEGLFVKLTPGRHIDGLMQDFSISIANAIEILQCGTKPSTYTMHTVLLCFVLFWFSHEYLVRVACLLISPHCQ